MKKIRCAIYTRKSSEEGLEQSFNSLHAQRDACEAYILSQAGEGWVAQTEVYDDGGFSGGSMDRPALNRLMREVEAGTVDVIVVYKVDRLTRSLGDFARIVEVLDKCGASFVSVTQAFNTTTSMGRLTLNVLLSFAQFEREVTGERIRDKIAASKARGMWMGGTLSLGYDLGDRALVVNEAEAKVVRHIFERYLLLRSVTQLAQELDREAIRSKSWIARSGRVMGGALIGRGGLFHMLKNRLYIGEITHKDKVHPGQHPAIVDRDLFEAVQTALEQNRVNQRDKPTRAAGAMLQGLLFDADGKPMSPSFAYGKNGKLYRYYIAMQLQTRNGAAPPQDAIRRVAADQLERFVVSELGRMRGRPIQETAEVRQLVKRIDLRAADTQILLDGQVFVGEDHPEIALGDLQARLGPEARCVWEKRDRSGIRVVLPVRMTLRGGRAWLDGVRASPAAKPAEGLVDALRSSHAELLELNASPLTSANDLPSGRAPDNQHRRQLSRLPFLAPDLQRALLEGDHPPALKLRTLLKTELPLAWADQRAWFASLRAA